MTNRQIEEKVTELEERIQELETGREVSSHTKWKVILLLGVWLIAALFAFSPIGAENMKEVLGTAGTATFLIVLLF